MRHLWAVVPRQVREDNPSESGANKAIQVPWLLQEKQQAIKHWGFGLPLLTQLIKKTTVQFGRRCEPRHCLCCGRCWKKKRHIQDSWSNRLVDCCCACFDWHVHAGHLVLRNHLLMPSWLCMQLCNMLFASPFRYNRCAVGSCNVMTWQNMRFATPRNAHLRIVKLSGFCLFPTAVHA